MEAKRKIIEIDEERCDGCGQCVIACAEGAMEIVDGKARLVKDSYCDGLGACLGECPQGALKIIEREADAFDHEAVEERLKEIERAKAAQAAPMPCGCPSSQIRMLQTACEEANRPASREGATPTALGHWPIQIRLVPPNAPFLKNAHLLVAADCAPVAYPDFHRSLLRGKAVMLGCPKFDNADEYVKKFAEIFRTADIQSITVVDMEVPCCSALPRIVKKGLELSGKQIPLEEVVIGVGGDILQRGERLA